MGRTKFKWQGSFTKIYRVGPKLQYTTIQSAINQAVADLVTPNAQNFAASALVEVYDKGSAYAENLTIYPGIFLAGVTNRQTGGIPVSGNHTLAFTAGQAAQTQAQNTLAINNLNFSATTGIVFTLGGTAPVEVRLTDCGIAKLGSVDGIEAFLLSNSNANARLRLIDSVVQYSDTQGVAGTSYAFRLQNSFQVEWFGGRSGFTANGAGNASMARLEGAASIFSCSFHAALRGGGGSTNFPTQIAAFGPYVFELANAGSSVNIQNATISNNFTNGSLANYVAAGTVRILNSFIALQSTTSKIANGASGNLAYLNMGVNSTSGEGRNTIDSGITVTEIDQGAKFKIEGSQRSFRVGLGGFLTVQAAVNAAAASSATEKVVQVTPGTYNEDVTVPLGVKIMGESKLVAGEAPACNIRSITIDPSSGSGDVIIENIGLTRTGSSSYVLRTIGANALTAFLVNCVLSCQNAGTTDSLIELQNTNASSLITFKNCSYIFQTDNASHPLIDAAHAFTMIDGQKSFGNPDFYSLFFNNISGSVGSVIRLAANVEAEIIQTNVLGNIGDNKIAEINTGARLRVHRCKLSTTNLATLGNEMFLYSGNGTIELIESEITFSDDSDEGYIARDSGTRAAATVTVDSSNTFAVGDAVVVNGVSFVYNVDWVAGVDASATATNIKTAINASTNPAVQGVVYARNSGSAITVYSRKNGTSQNAPTNTLSVVDTGGTSFTGVATFAGGTNGAGGTLRYGACAFGGESKTDAVVTTSNLPSTLTAV